MNRAVSTKAVIVPGIDIVTSVRFSVWDQDAVMWFLLLLTVKLCTLLTIYSKVSKVPDEEICGIMNILILHNKKIRSVRDKPRESRVSSKNGELHPGTTIQAPDYFEFTVTDKETKGHKLGCFLKQSATAAQTGWSKINGKGRYCID